jgi:VWFA-related protein
MDASEAAMLMAVLAAAASVSMPLQERAVPEFRSDVRVIRLDVSVVDRRGQPVTGLTPRDFVVLENGRPVEITFFEAVQGGASAGVETTTDEATVSAPPPRRIVLLVDTGRMSHAQLIRARQSVARYLRESATEGDWVRLVNLSSGRAWDGRIPMDRERLLSAAQRLYRRGSPWGEASAESAGSLDDPIEDKTETESAPGRPSETVTSGQFLSAFSQGVGVLGMVEALLTQLEGLEGRKALVLLSPGFPQLRGLDDALQRVASQAREAATAVYFVDATGMDALVPEPGRRLPPAFAGAWARSGGAQDLAEATGGFTARFANSLLPALQRVGAEMQTYYVIGYAPAGPNNGRFRSVKVKVDVPGASARTKKGYLAVPGS